MNISKIIEEISKNSVFLMVLSILSVFISIYLSSKKSKKKIRFKILRKEDNYIVAFWNASDCTIYREDLHHFFAKCNVNCKNIKEVFSTDDIPLDITINDKDFEINRHYKRVDFSFDFLNKRQGYVVEINNLKHENYREIPFSVFGRIRGENKHSVKYHKIYAEQNLFKNFHQRIGDRVSLICSAIFAVLYFILSCELFVQSVVTDYATGVLFGLLFGIAYILLIIKLINNFYLNSIPYKIGYKIKKYIKNENYYEYLVP